jgi:hypothetical protein
VSAPAADPRTAESLPGTACVGCGTPDAEHLGELRSTRVAEGIVSAARVRRCTPCQQIHRAARAVR